MDRKISLSHMAFYRDWLKGLSLGEVAELYLETGVDLRHASKTLAWIRDTLQRAALQHGNCGEARLVRLRLGPPQRSTTHRVPMPIIDAFRAHIAPGDFYTSDKLSIRGQDSHPPVLDRRTQRHLRILTRQAAVLTRLEQSLVNAPLPTDSLEEWLHESFILRLTTSGLTTIGDLMACMKDRGYHWYAAVPGLGRAKAVRLVRWMQNEAASLGPLPTHVFIPPHVAPLVEDPAAPGSQAAKMADRRVITAWLDACACSVTIRREYQSEAERLMLWAHHERGRSLGQLTVEDANAYQDFLISLGRTPAAQWPFRLTQADWCTPHPTLQIRWSPFEGPLSPHAALYALSVMRCLYAWLTAVTYVVTNPWSAMAGPIALPNHAPVTESATRLAAAWTGLQATLASPFRERADALLWLAMMTGLSCAELSRARSEYLHAAVLPGNGTQWMLKVPRRGGKWRAVALSDRVMMRLTAWWRASGHPADPATLPIGLPLIGQAAATRRDCPLAPTGVRLAIKKLFARGQAVCRATGEQEAAALLAKVSKYWAPARSRRSVGQTRLDIAALDNENNSH
jgi:site-specific recombinase XerD